MNTLIIDNFLSKKDNDAIINILPKLPYYLHGSTGKELTFLMAEITQEHEEVFNPLISIIMNNIREVDLNEILRVYVNLNPTGYIHSGRFHQDDGDITILYYPCNWDPDNGGGTLLKNGNYIEYKKNRLVLFEAKEYHRALEHNDTSGFRYSIAIKTTGKFI
jgi:hypothetical protein